MHSGIILNVFSDLQEVRPRGTFKMQALEIEKVAVSHGPILDTGIAHAMELYKKWSTLEAGGNMRVIAYVSRLRLYADACGNRPAGTGIERL